MKTLNVESSSHDYNIFIGESIRFKLDKYITKDYHSIMIITDKTVADLYLNDIKNNFEDANIIEAIIPVGEQSKNINLFYELQSEAIKGGLDRTSLILALGGGVVGDLAGFVAATFLRGIDYIQIPTTILAHDSSVGGKVAINHERGKNLIGCFYPPQSVIYDIDTLKTLSAEQIRSGYAELVKEALIADPVFLNSVMNTNLMKLSNTDLKEHLEQGIKVKASIVESDEKEAGVRMYLNLGHTLGHAIEAELGYGKLTHGEAVAIGLLFAIYVSEKIYDVDLPYQSLYDWLLKNNYSMNVSHLDINHLIEKMQHDKKVVNKKIQMVLLKGIGEPIITDISNDDIRLYLKAFKEELVTK